MAAIAAATLLSGCGSSGSTAVKYTITGCDSSFIDGQYMYIFTHNAGKAEWPDSALISNHSVCNGGGTAVFNNGHFSIWPPALTPGMPHN